MRKMAFIAAIALGCAFASGPVLAEELSGGGSGGGAIQGGDGAPGGGVGIPGSIVNNTTATGIGENDTLGPQRSSSDYLALAPAAPDVAQPVPVARHARHAGRHNRHHAS